jgi:hypothetical protein
MQADSMQSILALEREAATENNSTKPPKIGIVRYFRYEYICRTRYQNKTRGRTGK